MDAVALILFVVLLGAAPALTLFLQSQRNRYLIATAWLVAAAALLLQPSANSRHSFGTVFFIFFSVGWVFALSAIYLKPSFDQWRSKQ